MHDPDDDAFEAAFLRGLLDDAESKTAVDVESWVARFPNREAVIRRAWSSATSGETDDARSDERRVGRYEILELLGSGGQGDVYRALDTDLGRHVALKRLSRLGSLSPTRLARFRREAETASRIDHPGLCPVYETGIDEGVPFIVMRHIQGESLARRLVRRRGGDDATIAPSSATEVDELVAIFEKIARSLHAAHEGGILHRDVKPGNIMVGDDGEPVLLDFGLARPTDDVGEALTETGDFLGTPAYMSPEQLGGAGSRLDRRTDVYSLAATLYECLTLRRPFDVPTRDALFHAILHESPIDPRRLNPGVGKDLAVVLRVALEKDVDRRYDTAAAFADDLHRVAARRPIAARPPRPWTRLLRWAQRNPVLAVTATALLAALIAGTAISLYFAAEAAARLGDWERLADRRRLEDLVQEANTVLWPATPEKVPAIAGWLARARPVAARLPSHREALERLRAAARPYDADAAARNRALFFFEEAEELEALTAEIDAARRKLEEFEESDHSRRDRVEETLDDLENRRADLRDRVAERRLWELDTPEDQLRHDALADLVRKLAEFSGAPAPGRVTIGGLTERLADASSLIARTIDAHALEWCRGRSVSPPALATPAWTFRGNRGWSPSAPIASPGWRNSPRRARASRPGATIKGASS